MGILFLIPAYNFAIAQEKQILITQIQTSGGSGKTTQEFIEIYNPHNEIQDISHFKLVKWTRLATSTAAAIDIYSFATGTILNAHAYILIAHSDYNTSTSVSPDFLYADTSIADNNTIALIAPDGEIIDLVGMGSATRFLGENTAPNPNTNQSISRIKSTQEYQNTYNNAADFTKTISDPKNSVYATATTYLPPISIKISPSTTIDIGYSVNIRSATSSASHNHTYTYSWEVNNVFTTTSPEWTYTPKTTGTYKIDLTLTNADQLYVTSTVLFVIPTSTIQNMSDTSINTLIKISEVYINPLSGETEWIELYNDSNTSTDLADYALYDNASSYTLRGTLPPKQYFLHPLANKLNNDGDIVILKFKDTLILDEMKYGTYSDTAIPAHQKGESLIRIQNDWIITTHPTPAAANIFVPKTTATETVTTNTPEEIIIPNENSQNVTPTDHTLFHDIRINELLPVPANALEEFIELYNTTDHSILLDDWYITDSSNAKTFLSGTINAKNFVVIFSPKGKLNNAGDTITLFTHSQKVIDTYSYGTQNNTKNPLFPKTNESISLNLNSNQYLLTQVITPNSKNIFVSSTTDTLEQIETPAPSTTPITTSKNQTFITTTSIYISEALPNPEDAEEYIELYNPTNETQNLFGLLLDDADGGSKPYAFDSNATIAPFGFLTIYARVSNLQLNNSGDSIRILNQFGDVMSSTSYTNAKPGMSWSLDEMHHWQWTDIPTPNEKNLFSVKIQSTPNANSPTLKQTKTEISTTITNDFPATPIIDAKQLPDDTLVSIVGTLSAAPGILGSQIFYLQDVTGGIQVYLYDKSFPEIPPNQKIQILGTKTTVRDEARIRLASAGDIFFLETTNPYPPIAIDILTDAFTYDAIGNYIEVSGIVLEAKKSYFYLTKEKNEIEVSRKYIADIPIELTTTTVRGILKKSGDAFILFPTIPTDIIQHTPITPTSTGINPSLTPTSISSTFLNITDTNKSSSDFLVALFSSISGFVGGISSHKIREKFFSQK